MLKKIMKAGFSVFMGAALLCSGSIMSFATADDEIGYTVDFNGEELAFDQYPINVNGRILVPVRAIFEAYGAEVEWNSASKQVTATRDDTTIKLTIDSTTAYVNNKKVTLDAAATIVNGRTMVPVRFVSEALDAEVEWDEETATVLITADMRTGDGSPEDAADLNSGTAVLASADESASTSSTSSAYAVFTDIKDITNSVGFFSTQQGIKGACYLTCLGMIASNLNNEKIYASHVYKLNKNSVNQHDFFGLLSKLNITRTNYYNLKGKTAKEKITQITSLLSENSEGVIIRFLNGNKSHYVVVKGFKDGKLIVNDPVGQSYVPLDKCWTGYSMFSNYGKAVDGIVLVEAYNKGSSKFSWSFLNEKAETSTDDDDDDDSGIIEE